jgi:hypothetical protein
MIFSGFSKELTLSDLMNEFGNERMSGLAG